MRKHITVPQPAQSPLVVTQTTEQVAQLVRESMLAALAEYEAGRAATPEFIDTATLAQKLSVSPQMVNRWGREGAPHLRAGDMRRWRMADVVAWLASRTEAAE